MATMGQMCFYAPDEDRLSPATIERAYMSGLDGIPWQSRNVRNEHVLHIYRQESESGNLFLPWQVQDYGELVLSTASLMERETPYHLNLELARGTLNRLRSQMAAMEFNDLDVPEDVRALQSQSLDSFIDATLGKHDPPAAAAAADLAIRCAVEAIELLVDGFAGQTLDIRLKHSAPIQTLLAAAITPAALELGDQLTPAVNSACLPLSWNDLEPNNGEFQWEELDQQLAWCRQNGLKVFVGPIVQLEKQKLPDWLYLYQDDFQAIRNFVTNYVEQLVKRYQGQVQIWHACARFNVAHVLGLSEEKSLRLAVDVIETIRQLDLRTPIIVSFDQPFAEYLGRESRELSPLHFADTLVRAEVGIAGLGLELNWGYTPGGTARRDLLALSEIIDRWTVLGLPLLAYFTCPTSFAPDPLASRHTSPMNHHPACGDQPQHQRYLEQVLKVILAKPAIHALVWNQLSDGMHHEFPSAGLFDAENQPKWPLELLTKLRKQYLF